MKQLQKLGLVKKGVEHAPPMGELGKSWHEMTKEEQKESARKMEVYAGMVDMIDQNIGRVVEWLEKAGKLDNTFILFMSDNGAEGLAMEAQPVSMSHTYSHNRPSDSFARSWAALGPWPM